MVAGGAAMTFSRLSKAGLALLAAVGATGAAAPSGEADLKVQLSGIRSAKGVVHLCLTSNSGNFLRCKDDRGALSRTVPAGSAARLDLGPVKPGTYALLVIHDENNNGKLDMTFGIPRDNH